MSGDEPQQAITPAPSDTAEGAGSAPPSAGGPAAGHGGHGHAHAHLFVIMNRVASSASRFFNLPTDRVFELRSHVEI